MTAVPVYPSITQLHYKTTIPVNLNSASDTIINLPAKYIIKEITAHEASTTLAVSLAVVELRTASGGGGSNLMTSVLTGLTTATIASLQTVLSTTTVRTETSLYLRPSTLHGSAATVHFTISILPLI